MKDVKVEIRTGTRKGTIATVKKVWTAINGKDYVQLDISGQNILLAKNVRIVA